MSSVTNGDKMLELVLSDTILSSSYGYKPEDFRTIADALVSDQPVVVAVAKIIQGLISNSEKTRQGDVYKEVFSYLQKNLL
jgi:hypothetical protein